MTETPSTAPAPTDSEAQGSPTPATDSATTPTPGREFSPRLGAAVVAGALLIIYFLTGAPGVTGEDSGELAIAAWNWSLAHPPGYPLFSFVGWLWLWPAKWFGLDAAWWLAVLSGLLGAAAAYHLARAVTGNRRDAMSISRGAVAAAVTGLAVIWWAQCTVVEVYPLAMLLMALSWRAFRTAWDAETTDLGVQQRQLMWLALLCGLGAGSHPAAAICALILGLAVVARAPGMLASPGTWLRVVLAAVPGVLVLASMLWRSAATPDVAWAQPQSFADLLGVLNPRSNYSGDYPRWGASAYFTIPFGAMFRGLGWVMILPIVGLLHRLWEHPTRRLAVVELLVAVVLVVLVLANSQTRPDDPSSVAMHHVLMFFLWPMVGFWTAETLFWLAQVQPKPGASPLNDWRITAGGGALITVVLLTMGWSVATPDDISQQWLDAVEQSAPPDAVIVPEYDPHAFPLFYARHVGHLRSDIAVVNLYASHGPGAVDGLVTPDAQPGFTAERLQFLHDAFPGRPILTTDLYSAPPEGWMSLRIGVLNLLYPLAGPTPTVQSPGSALAGHPFIAAATARPVSAWDWSRGAYARDAWSVRLDQPVTGPLTTEEYDSMASAYRFVPDVGEQIAAALYNAGRIVDARELLGRLSMEYGHRKNLQHWLAMAQLQSDQQQAGFERLLQVAIDYPEDVQIWRHLVMVGMQMKLPEAREWAMHLARIGGMPQTAPQTQTAPANARTQPDGNE